jgi:glycine cleavage system H protein
MSIPEDLLYTAEHEWIREMGQGVFRIGITDYAQDQLGDVVFVELPKEGKTLSEGDLVAEIESTKSVGEVYAPFPGTVVAVNDAVVQDPSLVNGSPYDDGWLFDIQIDGGLPEGLLDAAAYRDLTE